MIGRVTFDGHHITVTDDGKFESDVPGLAEDVTALARQRAKDYSPSQGDPLIVTLHSLAKSLLGKLEIAKKAPGPSGVIY